MCSGLFKSVGASLTRGIDLSFANLYLWLLRVRIGSKELANEQVQLGRATRFFTLLRFTGDYYRGRFTQGIGQAKLRLLNRISQPKKPFNLRVPISGSPGKRVIRAVSFHQFICPFRVSKGSKTTRTRCLRISKPGQQKIRSKQLNDSGNCSLRSFMRLGFFPG